MYSIWVESSSKQLTQIKKVIKTLSEEENKDYFEPHVTLVTNLNSEHSAMNVFDKISKKRFDITFDTIQEGTTYFQRLFLISTDNTNFQNSIIVSIFFGVTSSVTGLYLSYFFNLPSGPTMSLVATGIFIFCFFVSKLSKVKI